ncbi:MAG: hypothetical protein ACTS7E_01100 [Arsenophonus sp. NC-CH8-MAG3]
MPQSIYALLNVTISKDNMTFLNNLELILNQSFIDWKEVLLPNTDWVIPDYIEKNIDEE